MSAATFSYAQAARGQQGHQSTSSSAPSTADSHTKDDVSTGNVTAAASSVVSNATEGQNQENIAQPEIESGLSKSGVEGAPNDDHTSTTEQAGQIGQTGQAAQEDTTPAVNTRQASEEKNSRSTSRTSRTNDGSDGKKSRKGKKGRAQDKDAQTEQAPDDGAEKEPVKPVVLTEAAPPAVNPWMKRAAEVFQGKEKHSVTGSATSSETNQRSAPEDGESQPTVNGVNGDKSTQKKSEAPRRSAPRGARANDREEKSAASLPAVSDSSIWPEPKAAAAQEQLPVRKVQEKSEASDKDAQDEAGPTRKITWERLPITPSVVFTSMPQTRGTKPRGGARGGRDQGSFRGHSNGSNTAVSPTSGTAGEKVPSAVGSTGTRATTSRPREGSVAARSTTQSQSSAPAKRAVGDGIQRKPSLPANTDQARDEISTSSRRYTKDIRTENGQLSPEGGQAPSRNVPNDRSKDVGHGAVNGHHPHYPVREGRSERSRGNGYRGRGAHVSSGSFASNGHYNPQAGFPSRHGSSSHGGPSLSGQHSSSYGHPGRGRAGKWPASNGQSTRNSASLSGSFHPKAPQANEFAVNAYAPAQYAYQQPYYQTDQMLLLIRQIEYYFSVENLCKDIYFRQHLDGSGFTRLDFIASFARVKLLTDDLGMVRAACLSTPKVFLVWDEHGVERLRPTFPGFEHFILPEAQRNEEYRNDGPLQLTPALQTHFPETDPQAGVPQAYFGYPTQQYPAYAQDQMLQHQYANGGHFDHSVNGGQMNGYPQGHETLLSPGVPEFQPPEEAVTLDSMTSISDTQVNNLVVVVVNEESGDEAVAPRIAGYVTVDSHQETNGVQHDHQSPNGEAPNNVQSEKPIVWIDGDSNGQNTQEPYTSIQQAALDQRQGAQGGVTPDKMEKLYRFWSRMLLSRFNAKIYQDFRTFALEDVASEVPSVCGLDYLIGFYTKLLLDTETPKPWPLNRAVPTIFTDHYSEAKELRLRFVQ
ncbi:La-related protein 1A [Podospora australis]|uniref:La-related protein 1A n=1 Tax=Podospora australis TaxID=1536484 RepID=A0AAN7AMY7_9PEZI|nr:La-related protein 1A [Podospora australis]